MKVLNLLEDFEFPNKIVNTKGNVGKIGRKSYDRDFSNSGNFSSVNPLKNRPGEVIKVANPMGKSELNQDGYLRFLRTITKNNRMQDNPYFPKIYGIKLYRDKDNNYSYVVRMEKLYKLEQLSGEEIEYLVDKIMFINDSKPFLNHLNKEEKIANDKKSNLSKLINVIKKSLGGFRPNLKKVNTGIYDSTDRVTNIKDPKLKEAVLLLKKLVRFTSNDIKPANLMFRRTSTGVQLVITDPTA